MLARLGYWRELEIAAAQSAAGPRVLDRLGLSGHCRNYGVEVNVFTSTPTDWNGRVLRLNLLNAGVARCPLRVPFRRTPPGSTDELNVEPTSSPTYCFLKIWPNLPNYAKHRLAQCW
jgi:hypothetical protein